MLMQRVLPKLTHPIQSNTRQPCCTLWLRSRGQDPCVTTSPMVLTAEHSKG